ncbi:unnamed protein product [Amaranthus hypochondriacus]
MGEKKWEVKKTLGIQPRKTKGQIMFVDDDVTTDINADVIMANQNLGFLTLLKFIFRIFSPLKDFFTLILVNPLTHLTHLYKIFKLKMGELELDTGMKDDTHLTTTNWTHKANFYPP